jgi:hypothetical protein
MYTMNITVFQSDEESYAPTKTDRELYYQKLEETSALSRYHFAAFHKMEIAAASESVPMSTIPAVIANYLIKYFVPVTSTKFFKIPVTPSTHVRLLEIGSFGRGVTERWGNTGSLFQLVGFTTQRQPESKWNMPPSEMLWDNKKVNMLLFESKEDALEKMNYMLEFVRQLSVAPPAIAELNVYTVTEPQPLPLGKPIKEVTLRNLDGMTNMGIQNAMMNEGLLNFYYRMRIKADPHLLKGAESALATKLARSNLKNIRTHVLAHHSRFMRIAKAKFGTTDLSKQQKRIVELEVERLAAQTPPNMGLSDALIRSFDGTLRDVRDALDAFGKLPATLPDAYLTQGDSIVCPHVVYRAQNMIKSKSMSPLDQDLIDKYAAVESAQGYHCRICGEKLANLDSDSAVQFLNGMKVSPHVADPLRSRIWREAAFSVGHARFTVVTNIKTIISSITDAVYPEISKAQAELTKIRSHSTDVIEMMMDVYITVYIMAVLVRMMVLNPEITFASRHMKSELSAEPKSVGGHAAKKKEAALRDLFNTAVHLVTKIRKQQLASSPFGVQHVRPLMVKAFRWAVNLKKKKITEVRRNLLNILNNSAMMRYLRWAWRDASLEKIMGRPLSELEVEGQSIYATVQRPATPPESFPAMYAFTVERTFDTPAIPISHQWLNFYDQFMARHTAPVKVMPKTSFAAPSILRTDLTASDVNLGLYYCPDGRRHVFDYVIDKKAMSTADIVKALETRRVKPATDQKCSLCGVLKSKARPTGVAKALEQINQMDAFFQYFAIKCPVEGAHEISDGKCIKCNFSKPTKAYYDKWKKAWVKESPPIPQRDTKPPAPPILWPTWKVNNKNVLKLADLVRVKYNVLINLGLSEGHDFSKLENGEENRYVNLTAEEARARNGYLLGYVGLLFRHYYTIKNTEIYEGDLLPFVELKATLPDIYDNFNEKAMQYAREPVLLSNYMLDFIAKSLLTMYQATKSKLAVSFARFIIGEIVEAEKMVSAMDSNRVKGEPVYATQSIDPIEEPDTPSEEPDTPSEAQEGGPAEGETQEGEAQLDINFEDIDMDEDDMDNLEGND